MKIGLGRLGDIVASGCSTQAEAGQYVKRMRAEVERLQKLEAFLLEDAENCKAYLDRFDDLIKANPPCPF